MDIAMKILIIEDDRKVAGFIQHGLKEAGYVADLAKDGEEGARPSDARCESAPPMSPRANGSVVIGGWSGREASCLSRGSYRWSSVELKRSSRSRHRARRMRSNQLEASPRGRRVRPILRTR